MIELQKQQSFVIEILDYVSKKRNKHGSLLSTSDAQVAQVLNQEKDGSVIYVYDDVTSNGEGGLVTHFAIYNPTSKDHQVIHVYSQRVFVASCSVNQEKTLMAFTTIKRDSSNVVGDKRIGKEKYNAFIAEIKAKNPRVFSLNLVRETFLKVQFLYEDKPAEKETFLLVMLHKESIGLYKIPLARVANGMVMRGQPKTEQIARKFMWCQWDNINQQLFYLHYRSDGHGNKQHLLTCLQFFNDAAHDHVLDVPMNFPVASKSSGRYYANVPLHNGIPDTSVNACVLTHNSGTFCFCYQYHVSSSDKKTKSSPLPRTSPLQRTSPLHHSSGYQKSPTGSDGETTDINYYICMVHHAKTIHGCVSSIPENVVRKAMVHFSWMGDLVMVMLPGYFVHLLNVGMEFEPCNHILLHNKSSMDNITSSIEQSSKTAESSSVSDVLWDSNMSLPVMSLAAEHLVFSSNYSLLGKESGNYLLERNSGDIYKIHINLYNLIQAFTHCHMSMTRTALLHYVILRVRDITLLKQMFLVLCNDIPSPEVPGLMSEFLIAMTYSGMRRQLDREVLRLLPFTSTEPFRGQFDKGINGDRIATVSYSQIHSVNIGTKSAKERQQRRGNVGDDWLDNLRRHLHWMQLCKSRRFTLDTVRKAFRQMLVAEETNLENKEDEQFLSQIRIKKSKMKGLTDTVSNYGNKTDSALGPVPNFLVGSTVTLSSEMMMSLTKDILVKHLTTYLNRDGKVKANAVAKEYVICQQTQSRLLCHMLWTLRGQGSQEFKYNEHINLSVKGNLEDYEVFQLLERYILVTGDVMFPVPAGFPSYFATIGFRCLNIRMFMQYVEHGIIQLTGDFMVQFIAELYDNTENVKLKQYVISKLPQLLAVECYKIWAHPICNQYLSYHQVAQILEDKSRIDSTSLDRSDDSRRSTFSQSSSSNTYLEDVSFQPLNSFFCYLDKLDKRRSSLDRQSPLDFQVLEEVALHHTTNETHYDMGTVNF
ncbi:hypothetical protein ACF0H5_013870 [Mactra antiquata]